MLSDEIFALFARRGAAAYGEQVSMTAHALQTAYFARAAGAPETLVIAALLHDVGHLLADVPHDLDAWHEDAQHERVGAEWLARRFAPPVSEPVRLHVPAKRYLCAVDLHYTAALSAASVYTLRLQGGPMTPDEVARFRAEPFHAAALELRHWDDQGKLVGFDTPALGDYRDRIESVALATLQGPTAAGGHGAGMPVGWAKKTERELP